MFPKLTTGSYAKTRVMSGEPRYQCVVSSIIRINRNFDYPNRIFQKKWFGLKRLDCIEMIRRDNSVRITLPFDYGERVIFR
jgi:hypothetical protein